MSEPVILSFNQIQPAHVEWLWEPYLARGKLAILDGDPGTGKSFFVCDLAARLSRGGPLPDGKTIPRVLRTLVLNAEDNVSDTIWHRLEAAGACRDDVLCLNGLGAGTRTPVTQFPRDLDLLDRIIRREGIALVTVDPMMAFFPPEVSANNDQCIRQALTPLADLAGRTGAAVLLVRHLNKAGGPRAIYRGSGSVGIIGAIRTGLFLSHHPLDRDRRVLAMTKTNIGPLADSLEFRLKQVELLGTGLEWLGKSDYTANDLCVPNREPAPRAEAVEWLKTFLAGRPRKATDVQAEGEKAGHSWRTLNRAKEELGVKSEQVWRGMRSEWYWSLPGDHRRPPSLLGPDDLPPLPDLPDLPPLDDDDRERARQMHRAKMNEWKLRTDPPRGPLGDRGLRDP